MKHVLDVQKTNVNKKFFEKEFFCAFDCECVTE